MYATLPPHLKSVKKKAEKLLNNPEQHVTRIIIALGYISHSRINQITKSIHHYQKAISRPDFLQSISVYDRAVLLIYLSYDLILLGNPQQAIFYIEQVQQLVSHVPSSDILLAMNAITKATFYNNSGDFESTVKAAKSALKIVENSAEPWARPSLSEVYHFLFVAYLEHYMTKPQNAIGIEYAHKLLDLYQANPHFSKDHRDLPKEFPAIVFFIRRGLANFYNAVGNYKKSLEEITEAEYILKFYHEQLFTIPHLWVLREKSAALTQLGKPRWPEEKLSYVVEMFKKMNMIRYAMFATEYRIYTRVKLHKWKEAYQDCLDFINFKNYGQNNDYVSRKNKAHYHAAFIQYRINNPTLSLKHFFDFFRSIKDFCRGFLEKEQYETLLKDNIFAIPQDQVQIPQALHQATQIFTAIYGPNHPFVKAYIVKNEKPLSWFTKTWKKVKAFF